MGTAKAIEIGDVEGAMSSLSIFRHLAQKSLDIRQYACGISIQSDEKSVGASPAQALCGIAYNDSHTFKSKF